MFVNMLDILKPRVVSFGEARRLISKKAISINGVVVPSSSMTMEITLGDVIQIGKHIEIPVTQDFLDSILA